VTQNTFFNEDVIEEDEAEDSP
jgi:hypothetical protein